MSILIMEFRNATLLFSVTIFSISYMTNSFLRKNNIEGAPFKIGDKVKILNNPSNDDTFNSSFVTQLAEVIFFEYDCGCGQTFPNDPMIGVKLQDGRKDEFWKEELERLI